MTSLEMSTERLGSGVVLVTVAGDIDLATRPAVRDELTGVLRPPPPEVVLVDLSDVTFLSSAGMQALVELHERAGTSGTRVRLVSTAHCVRRPLEATGMHTVLGLHDTREEAFAELQGT